MMKHILVAAACFILLSNQIAIAQNTGNTSSANAQDLFGQYNSKFRNSGLEGRQMLEDIQAQGLAKTAENVKSTRSLLSSSVTSDEKVVLARILGSLYTYGDKTGMNNAITSDLKGLVYTGQKEVARAGVLAFSRLGYFRDSNDVLLYARNNGFIDTDEYYAELAHIVLFAPAHDQVDLVSKIKDGKNRYATEILASITQDPEAIKNVYPETQKSILSSLDASEPAFAQALGEFSLIDAVRYSTWLQSVANLSSAAGNVKYEDVVLARLNDDKIDPRKIMAFLMSPEGKNLIKKIGQSSPFDKVLERVSLYSKQLPQNVLMKQIVQDIKVTIKSVKG
ncbi:MAG: hypothetical protein NTY41_07155 [Proteobacteria bacterium]|nr:hypothetical protein [Pseudomonadota bacterium]